MTAAVVSAIHLLALVFGLAGVFVRGLGMREPFDERRQALLFHGDNAWGVAALLWIGSGLYRLLGALDKPTEWYLKSPAFHAKLGLFAVVFLLELWPMVTFVRWRIALQKKQPIDTRPLRAFRVINTIEVVVVVAMVFVAAAMARGVGKRTENVSPACAVRDLFVARCAQCHSSASRQGGLDLADPHAALVNVQSSQFPSELRVVPGDPERSLLYRKLAGTHGDKGQRMPLGAPLLPEEIERVARWIKDGAPRCP